MAGRLAVRHGLGGPTDRFFLRHVKGTARNVPGRVRDGRRRPPASRGAVPRARPGGVREGAGTVPVGSPPMARRRMSTGVAGFRVEAGARRAPTGRAPAKASTGVAGPRRFAVRAPANLNRRCRPARGQVSTVNLRQHPNPCRIRAHHYVAGNLPVPMLLRHSIGSPCRDAALSRSIFKS